MRISPGFKRLGSWTLAVVLLYWVTRDIDWTALARQTAGVQWGWIAAAMLLDSLAYVFEGARWQLLLRPLGELPVWRATQAIYAGLFANEILPMRVGDVLRVYLASRWLQQPMSALIPSVVVSRSLDLVWTTVFSGLLVALLPLPEVLLRSARVLGVSGLLFCLALSFVITRGSTMLAGWGESDAPHRRFLTRLASGFQEIGREGNLAGTMGHSFGFLACQAAAFLAVIRACQLQIELSQAVAVFLIVHVGTAVPSTPANLGAYQFFTVLGLTLFGVDKTAAVGFSAGVFLVLSAPLMVLGFLALTNTGIRLRHFRRDLGSMHTAGV